MGFLDDISVVQGKERMEALRERFKKNLDFFLVMEEFILMILSQN